MLEINKGNIRLSILVPVFNWDILLLLEKLATEINMAKIEREIEVIFIDDGSDNVETMLNNRKWIRDYQTKSKILLQLFENQFNLGRAGTRNLLVQKAKGEFLLFLDADVLPDDYDFIRRYLPYIYNNQFDAVCGGISYKTKIFNQSKYNFYLYLSNRNDVKPVELRNEISWKYILTSNILVRKIAFFETPFNIEFIGYGYEDIEWGYRLSQKFKILHIDNKVSHLGLLSKRVVFKKMLESINNYIHLFNLHPEAFKETSIYLFINKFSFINIMFLKIFDSILRILYNLSFISSITYIIFQLEKVILLTIQLKQNEDTFGRV